MESSLTLQVNKEDISSFANFDKIQQTNIFLNIYEINFDLKTISAKVTIDFLILNENEQRIILDSKSILIKSVKEISESGSSRDLSFHLYDKNSNKDALGTPLVIELNESKKKNSKISIEIDFTTTSQSFGLTWMDKTQTLKQEHPFMFSQFQAILARTVLPCQDTPAVKIPVQCEITCEKPLTALFAGIETGREEKGNFITFKYKQDIPIPTYLIAFACGKLEYGKLSDRCGVWTEEGLCEKAVKEFENTEEQLQIAEKYLTPYVWGVYNILVLPFSFAYGGMENPCLTFVSNSLIAGDKSLTNVIAHEISHSWTGNLVTNKNWENFWMNEGFTTFVERKISELRYGEDMSNLENNVHFRELEIVLEQLGDHTFSKLMPDLTDVDPDDAFSRVPYEKGFTFLYFLESLVGKDNFQKILQKWLTDFAYKSIVFQDFRNLFEQQVKTLFELSKSEEILKQIDWEAWMYTPGKTLIKHNFSKYINFYI
jgi:leukotriene-A4 hydrolase